MTISEPASAARPVGPAGRGERVFALHETSLGWVGAVATRRGLSYLSLPRPEPGSLLAEVSRRGGRAVEEPSRFERLFGKLDAYFAGSQTEFDLPLDPEGTPFQLLVWQALRRIPYGETRSYGEVAVMIGRPRGARAVGQAVGSNPLAIVVPCHRVIAAGGRLGGFGGDLDLKKRLLAIEGVRGSWS